MRWSSRGYVARCRPARCRRVHAVTGDACRAQLNFVLRQYLKARVEKIQRYALHLEAQLAAAAQQDDDESMRGLLTDPEEKFLRGYLQLYQQVCRAVNPPALAASCLCDGCLATLACLTRARLVAAH